ncbi:S24/S26 family peptidase [Marinobacter sp. LN3S78]|uniref:S24/S26 family peptidase n=1 Tax=Marinobacter sp. LN3S78 TaxID=3382300 RepID=UPI00387B3624
MQLKLYRVIGDSMLPDLAAGSFVVTLRHRAQTLRVNDVVVVEHAIHGRMIKRVIGIGQDGALSLAGDNAARSTSTEALGPIPPERVLGRVIWRIPGITGSTPRTPSSLP